MESIEAWMWVVAGVVIAGLILVGSYQFLAKYFYNADFEDARSQLDSLAMSANQVCSSGLNSQETATFRFSRHTRRIFVKNEAKVEGVGKLLCMDFESEPSYCSSTNVCEMEMAGIDLSAKLGALDFISEALGRNKPVSIEFQVQKRDLRKLAIKAKKTYV